ncbi:MAG: secretion protein HlyD [Cyanobacteria bacterium RYN_339]|nr:secretion protein HlyD [Cyanobacteria bacterium RYN_339]
MSETTETKPDQAAATPTAGPPPKAPNAPPAAPKRKPPFLVIGVVAVIFVITAYYGWGWWTHRQAFVATDDAQVAADLVTVSGRVPGHIAELPVDEGATVKAGQVIAKLDDTDFKAQVAQAESALVVAKSNLQSSQTGVSLQTSQNTASIAQAEAGVTTAAANLTRARADANKASDDLGRVQKLYAVGGISRRDLDSARAMAQTNNAGVASAAGQLRASQEAANLARANAQAVDIKKGSVETVQAQIRQAEATLANAKLQLSHTVITAPANGIVARRMANVGEQVQPGQGIYAVAKTDTIWVLAYVEETQIRRVAQGAPVDVHIDAFPHKVFKGQVALVNVVTGSQFSLMPQNNASGNYTKVVQRIPVKVTVDDPDHQLKPGMSAVIDIEARH